MAGIKKKSGGGGGANWMDTYGDMVTLLLCFFVLLYSISSIDEQKWMLVVQSFNKNALVSTDDTPRGPEGENGEEGGDEMPMTTEDPTDVETVIEDLYEYIVSAMAAQSDSVKISKGDGYVFVSFRDALFFDGDKSTLRPEGQAALDAIIPGLEIAAPFIDEVKIMGHTAQANVEQANTIRGDTVLSSDRAAEVKIYLLEHVTDNTLDPARVISMGYGQWRPVASNDTPEGRAQNRRVEMMISGKDIEERLADSLAQYYAETGQVDPNVEPVGTADPAEGADTAPAEGAEGESQQEAPNIASGELLP